MGNSKVCEMYWRKLEGGPVGWGMEGGLAMLRQLIGEFEELLELYHRSPPHSYLHLQSHSQLLQPPPHYQHRSLSLWIRICVSNHLLTDLC